MPAIHKRRSQIRLEFVANDRASVHGGLAAVEALCEQFGLWEKLRALVELDPRRRKGRGYSPEVIVAQLLYSVTSGGVSLADSGSSAGVYLEAIRGQNFAQWSVSYNNWVGPLERTAAGVPEAAWGPVQAARWRDGSSISEQHGFIRHQPEGCQAPLSFAVVRFRRAEEMFWNYRFMACDETRPEAAAVLARHRLKGEKELLLKEVLRGLDLHHPPCRELNANRMFYAIAALAYNVLAALKLLHLPEDCQGWQLKTLLSKLLLLPAQLVRHARMLVARVQVPAVWLAWWRNVMLRLWPAPVVGRPSG
ncbi:MAG TPA: transposase [Verrucomicrobiae bacterium]|nr:transposase [Verrucomicrobiae bacterium]